MNNSLTRLPGWMFSTLRGLFSSVSITKIGNSVSFLILNLEPHFFNTYLVLLCRQIFHITMNVEPWSEVKVDFVAHATICRLQQQLLAAR